MDEQEFWSQVEADLIELWINDPVGDEDAIQDDQDCPS